MKKALVIGVGPLNGLGGQLCRKIANNNFEVFVAGRTRSSLNNVVNTICLMHSWMPGYIYSAMRCLDLIKCFSSHFI